MEPERRRIMAAPPLNDLNTKFALVALVALVPHLTTGGECSHVDNIFYLVACPTRAPDYDEFSYDNYEHPP
jgi:hypothetical protein